MGEPELALIAALAARVASLESRQHAAPWTGLNPLQNRGGYVGNRGGNRVELGGPFPSVNSTGPVVQIPGVAGNPTGLVAPAASTAAIVFNTSGGRICIRSGGSWFASPSMALL